MYEFIEDITYENVVWCRRYSGGGDIPRAAGQDAPTAAAADAARPAATDASSPAGVQGQIRGPPACTRSRARAPGLRPSRPPVPARLEARPHTAAERAPTVSAPSPR